MLVEIIWIAALGKLSIFIFRQFSQDQNLEIEFFKKLVSCDLCLGVWIFFALIGYYRIPLVEQILGVYIPIVDEFLSAIAMSFIIHLISIGWTIKFSRL